jgi:hypothetical protein
LRICASVHPIAGRDSIHTTSVEDCQRDLRLGFTTEPSDRFLEVFCHLKQSRQALAPVKACFCTPGALKQQLHLASGYEGCPKRGGITSMNIPRWALKLRRRCDIRLFGQFSFLLCQPARLALLFLI